MVAHGIVYYAVVRALDPGDEYRFGGRGRGERKGHAFTDLLDGEFFGKGVTRITMAPALKLDEVLLRIYDGDGCSVLGRAQPDVERRFARLVGYVDMLDCQSVVHVVNPFDLCWFKKGSRASTELPVN